MTKTSYPIELKKKNHLYGKLNKLICFDEQLFNVDSEAYKAIVISNPENTRGICFELKFENKEQNARKQSKQNHPLKLKKQLGNQQKLY